MKPGRPVLGVVVSAAVARWLFCFVAFPAVLASHSTVGKRYYFDSYREIASSLVAGRGYRLGSEGPPALHRPPLYVAFLMLCDPADPARCYLLVQLWHGVLGALAALLTIRAALAWGVGRKGAIFAGWVVALWPFAIWESKVTVPENLLIALVPAVLLALSRPGYRAAALVGLLAAGLALTHPTYQIALLPLAAAVWLWPLPRANHLAALALMLLTFSVPVGVWTLRNRRLGYDGIAVGFGYNYFRGLYAFDQLVHGAPFSRDHDAPATAFIDSLLRSAGRQPIDSDAARSDPEINRFLDRRAIEHLRGHPSYTAAKTLVTMPLAWVQQRTALRSTVTGLMLTPLVVLALAGMRRRKGLGVALAILVSVNAGFALVAVEAIPMRYMLPLMPLLAILAGAGLPVVATGRFTIDPRRGVD